MRKYINDLVNQYEQDLNVQLMNKENDFPLYEYVLDVWRSLEVIPNIKFLGYEYDEDESHVDINRFIFRREKKGGNKKKDKIKRQRYKYIDVNRCGILTVKLQISLVERDKTGNFVQNVKIITKKMLIPIQDDRGYYYIKGKRFYMIYQLTDKSTYNSNNTVTTKTLMPVPLKRITVKASDINGNDYVLPAFNMKNFHKEIPLLLFFLANGLNFTLVFLKVQNIIKFYPSAPKVPRGDKYYFQISSKCIMEVDKKMYDKYHYVQTIAGGFIQVCTNRMTVETLYDEEMWKKKLYTVKRDALNFLNRMLDETSKKILLLDRCHTRDIYSLIRWMMVEYNDLRMKDVLSLDNKRLRSNELIAALLTMDFSDRIYRIIQLGSKATMDNFKDIFKFPGDILLQKMQRSGILRYDETINDMNFFTKFKYTSKGPNSLGNKNQNNISKEFRSLHPSYLGNIDIFVCGNSDPGTSGVLSPFGKINGLYFDDSKEPDEVFFEFMQDAKELAESEGLTYLSVDFDSPEEYYKFVDAAKDYTDDNLNIYITSETDKYGVVISTEEISSGLLTSDEEENTDENSEEKEKPENES